MAKYIDAEALKELFADSAALCNDIDEFPAADVVEVRKPDHGYMWICPDCGIDVHSDYPQCVKCGYERTDVRNNRHGRWLETYDEDPTFYRCSECGRLYDLRDNFCPSCGADMRGET